MKILVTGAAGFIGHHLVNLLIKENHDVIGIDSINDYYDVSLKHARLKAQGIKIDDVIYGKSIPSSILNEYNFVNLDITDKDSMFELFKNSHFDVVCNLAAQAGVRYSIEHPEAYIDANISGFLNILECCKTFRPNNLVYASSSSVYGLNTKLPFSEDDPVDHPISLYAATKRTNELFAHTYSHLFGMHTNGLRFFTVYGPWGRPDMALFKFTKAALEGSTIQVFNQGNMTRDFTYVDDIVNGIYKVILINKSKTLTNDEITPSTSSADYKIYNIGNSSPVKLSTFIDLIEEYTGNKIKKEYLPMQDGDVEKTFADVSHLNKDTNYLPTTPVEIGVKNFVEWYKDFYNYK
tara:strand:+ start:31 stop:1080 length:1050 start_codon:yes stop_codon:yes gene_type:complete